MLGSYSFRSSLCSLSFAGQTSFFPAAWLTEEALPVNIPSGWDLFRLFLRSVTIEFEPE